MATLKNFIIHACPPRWRCSLRLNIASDFKILEKIISGKLAEPKPGARDFTDAAQGQGHPYGR
jgi:hypothetical protein